MLTIQAGAGGTEAMDWAAMLLRMYARWADSQGFGFKVLDQTDGAGCHTSQHASSWTTLAAAAADDDTPMAVHQT